MPNLKGKDHCNQYYRDVCASGVSGACKKSVVACLKVFIASVEADNLGLICLCAAPKSSIWQTPLSNDKPKVNNAVAWAPL